jgi:GWxTD domain-containing protein
MRVHLLGACLLLCSPAGGQLRAQESTASQPPGRVRTYGTTPAVDSLLTESRRLVLAGDTNTALTALGRAQDLAPRNPEVLYQRGVLLSRTTFLRFGDVPRNFVAWRLLDRAAEIDPTNARYLLEIGRMRLLTPLLRAEAERVMRKALRVAESQQEDGLIAEITWELGQIKERRYLTAKDRYMVPQAGLIFEPDLAMYRRGYTREFLESNARPIENIGATDRTEAEEWYRRGLAAVPTYEPSAIGLLGLLYDQRRYEEMRRVVRPFLDAGAGGANLRLTAGLAAYRLNDAAAADSLFESGLRRVPEEERREMTSLGRILRRRDSVSYDALSAADRRLTDSSYWEAADPLRETPENEARLEFLARIAVAQLRFSSVDMRQSGWRTDRGLILARYGEPPVIATFAIDNAADAAETAGRITTVWYYPRKDRQFVFSGPPAMNYATFAGPMRGLAEESREDAPFLLDNVTALRAIDSVSVQLSRFRGATDSTSQLVVAHAVDPRRLYGSVDLAEGSLSTSVYMGRPLNMRQVRRDTINVSLPASSWLTRTFVQGVPAGPLRVRVESTDANVSSAVARAHMELDIARARRDILELSDVMISERVASTDEPLGGWQRAGIVPRGELTMAQREPFSVYWETYGLRPTPDQRLKAEVSFRVTLVEIDRSNKQGALRYLLDAADFVGLTREGNEELTVRFTREVPAGTTDRLPMVNTIGLGTSPAGLYRLDVIVTDLVSGQSARSARFFRVARS